MSYLNLVHLSFYKMETPPDIIRTVIDMMELSPKEMLEFSLTEKLAAEHLKRRLIVSRYRHLVLGELRRTIQNGTNPFIEKRKRVLREKLKNPPREWIRYRQLTYSIEKEDKFESLLGRIRVRLNGEHCSTYTHTNSFCECCTKPYYNRELSQHEADPFSRRHPLPTWRDYHCSDECYVQNRG